MTELEKVTRHFDTCVEIMKSEGMQPEKVSLVFISQSLIEIAKELAIMNDRAAKGENK